MPYVICALATFILEKYNLQNIIRMMKQNNNELVRHMTRMGESRVHTGFSWGDLSERDHLEDLSVDGRTIWNWIFKNLDGETWTGLIWIRAGRDGRHLWMRQWIFVLENCSLLGYYWSSRNFLPTFRGNLSVRNYHFWLHNNREERSSQLLRAGCLK